MKTEVTNINVVFFVYGYVRFVYIEINSFLGINPIPIKNFNIINETRILIYKK